MLNLRTGKTVWADGSFAPPVVDAEKPSATPSKAEREIRWGTPVVSDDGKYVVASASSADNKDRWLVTIDPETGKTRVIDTLHDDAWFVKRDGVRDAKYPVSAGQQANLVSPERDGWMHLTRWICRQMARNRNN